MGPITTLTNPKIIALFHDLTFNLVRATPSDIKTKNIVAYVNKKVVFSRNLGTSKLKYKNKIEIKIPQVGAFLKTSSKERQCHKR